MSRGEDVERIDDLQRRGCRIIQRPELFCFGMDAVLLSAWAAARRGDHVLDLCSGNGIVPILMDARLSEEIRREGSVHFTGVEINSISVDLALRSAQMNGQSERIRFLQGDVKSLFSGDDVKMKPLAERDNGTMTSGNLGVQGKLPTETLELTPGSFDCVTANPPYMTADGGLKGPSDERAAARHEVLCTIGDVASAARRALKQAGHLYMVHRPHRLGDIFEALTEHDLAIKRMRMVHPFADKEANMVLIDAVKGAKSYVHVEKPLVIYRETGVYTEELKALYG